MRNMGTSHVVDLWVKCQVSHPQYVSWLCPLCIARYAPGKTFLSRVGTKTRAQVTADHMETTGSSVLVKG